MMRSLNTAGTGMVAQQYNLDVIANNLANVNTTAYKAQRAEFQDLVYQNIRASGAPNGGSVQLPQATQVGLGSKFVGNASSFVQGPTLNTNNPLDVVIQGEGFFRLQLPTGDIAYTRDGALKRDNNGLLVNADGYPLEPNITVPASAIAITVAPNGTVSAIVDGNADPQTLGEIQLSTFTNPGGLMRVGQNLYRATAASGAAQVLAPGESGAGTLQSGFLEGSNVQIVEEMVRMILAQRAYEINSKAIQTADEMLGVLNSLKR